MPLTFNLLSSNNTFYKSDLKVILKYFFNINTPFTSKTRNKLKKRDNYNIKIYYIIFKQVYLLLFKKLLAKLLKE
jgi:hypothetical protein